MEDSLILISAFKLRHFKAFKSLFEQASIQIVQKQPKVFRSTPQTISKGKLFIGKTGKSSKAII